MMKCLLCNGTGVSTHYFKMKESPVTLKGPCGACAGTGELPREMLEQQLSTWSFHALKALVQMIDLDRPDLTLQEQNVVLYLNIEMEKITCWALDYAISQGRRREDKTK